MHTQAIYALVGLGGFIVSRATMTESRAALCNQKLNGYKMEWQPVGGAEAAEAKISGAAKAWATRRAAAEATA